MDTQELIAPAAPTSTEPAVNHCFFMLVCTTREWLQLDPPARFAFLGEVIAPVLAANPTVRMRFFDSEAFAADVTDVVMWETNDVMAYQKVVEELRETRFWDTYFEIVRIVASIENAYAHHYDVAPY
jgi:chlorite dismutase